jgi:Conjugal transfer protein TrbL
VHAGVAALLDPLGGFVHLLTGALVHFVDGARADLEQVLQRYLFRTVDTAAPGARALTDNPGLRRLNLGLVVAADLLLTAVLLVACLRGVFERTGLRARYSLKVVMPRLLLAVVLVHFSMPLLAMALDLDNALCAVAQSLGDELRVDGLPWSPVIGAPAVTRMSLGQDLFHAIFAVAVVIGLVILVLAYVVRHALLCVLIVVAPLAGLCTVLPDTRGYARGWMRLLSVTVLMQPVQLIVLRVAEVVAIDAGGGVVQSLYALATLFLMLKVPGALNVAAHLETKAETYAHRLERSVLRAVHHGHTTRRRA